MNKQRILYLYRSDSNHRSTQLKTTLIKELRKRYDVILYCSDQEYSKYSKQKNDEVNVFDVVLIQNSQCLIHYKTLLKSLKQIPWIFLSYGCGIHNCIANTENLFEVFNFGVANLKPWGIPFEMQTCFKLPVFKKNYFREKTNEESCHILYYPTDYTIHNADPIVVSISGQYKNTTLTIVSDKHSVLESSLPPNVKIVSRKASISALKKAHVVLASEQDAKQAMAYNKPCVIVGNYGLGGMVTSENYEILKKYDFQGRAGASFNEEIPIELLNYEIKKSISSSNKEHSQWIQKNIVEDYNYSIFRRKITKRINVIVSLAYKLKQKRTLFPLKPLRTSTFGTEKAEDSIYLKNGCIYYGEIDDKLLNVLEQFDGKTSIQKILSTCEYEQEDVQILCENILELWSKKLIIFNE